MCVRDVWTLQRLARVGVGEAARASPDPWDRPVVCAARPRVACAAVARPVRRSRSTSLAMSTADSSRGFDVSLGSGVLGSETIVSPLSGAVSLGGLRAPTADRTGRAAPSLRLTSPALPAALPLPLRTPRFQVRRGSRPTRGLMLLAGSSHTAPEPDRRDTCFFETRLIHVLYAAGPGRGRRARRAAAGRAPRGAAPARQMASPAPPPARRAKPRHATHDDSQRAHVIQYTPLRAGSAHRHAALPSSPPRPPGGGTALQSAHLTPRHPGPQTRNPSPRSLALLREPSHTM